MAWGAVVSYLSSGLGVLQLWVLTRPTQHAPQLQQAAELCAANRTDPSTVHQPYSVLPASPQQLAGWAQGPLTGRRRPALPPAADEGQQSWLRRLTHGLADLAWAGLAVVSPKAEQAVLQWKTWGRMLPEGTFWVLCETACCTLYDRQCAGFSLLACWTSGCPTCALTCMLAAMPSLCCCLPQPLHQAFTGGRPQAPWEVYPVKPLSHWCDLPPPYRLLACCAGAALYPEDHPTTRTAQQLLQQALAAAKAEAKQHPDTASAMLLSASPPEIRVYSHPVGCTVAGRTDGQRIVLWDRFNDAHTVAHELAHCLLRHCDESAQLMRSPERWSHYGVLRCQQELEAEQCALLWAARWAVGLQGRGSGSQVGRTWAAIEFRALAAEQQHRICSKCIQLHPTWLYSERWRPHCVPRHIRRMGAAPKQYVRRQISGSPWWHPLLPSGIGTHALQGWLHRHAAADPTALTSVDSRDRGGTGVWPSEAKQAHFYALVLPRAAQLYASSAAVTRSRLIGAAVVAALSFQGERMQNSLAWLFVSLLL